MSEVHMALYYLFIFILLKSKSYNLRFSVLAKLQKKSIIKIPKSSTDYNIY
jgi:hypothetical protein